MTAQPVPEPPDASAIDGVLAAARSRLSRVGPAEAHAELLTGALLVDIRPHAQRVAHGEVPGSLVIERNVLEWRLDPASPARIPEAIGASLRVLVLCQEGYASSLAAASLQDIGLHLATDVDGGFERWHRLGLPTVPGGTPAGRRVAPSSVSAA
jgi:rhodanese-related sulfurtransferase